MTWKLISTQEKYRNRFMTVTEDKLLTDEGQEVTFGIVHKLAGVSIIPWDGQYFTLIGQYRYAVNSFSWEFPAGHMEHGSVIEAARAELREEAGILAGKIEKIGEFFLAPGHNTQIIHFYLAQDLSANEQELEPAELGMQIKKVTFQDLKAMINKGEIKDSLTIGGVQFLELWAASHHLPL